MFPTMIEAVDPLFIGNINKRDQHITYAPDPLPGPLSSHPAHLQPGSPPRSQRSQTSFHNIPHSHPSGGDDDDDDHEVGGVSLSNQIGPLPSHRNSAAGSTRPHAAGQQYDNTNHMIQRRPTGKEKVKNWLIRPRKTPWGDYSGHALSEPIDTVKSLFSMFTTEFIGSAILSIFTMSIATAINQNIDVDNISRVLAISFTFMFGIMVTIATDSKMSANSAASFTALLLGRMSVLRTLVSILATHVGWTAGSGISKGIMGELLSEVGLSPNYGVGRAFGAELIVTACVFATIFTTELEKGLHRPLAPLYISSAFFLGHMLLVDKTGASINPSRSLGPSIVNGHFPPHFWVSQIPQYLAGFITAGVVTAKKYILEKEAEQKRQIDPNLVESDAPMGPEILLTNREVDRNIRRDARNLYEEARQQV